MPRCYRVRQELDVLIVADSPEEARRLADDALRDDLMNRFGNEWITEADELPEGWTPDCNVYQKDPSSDMRCDEALKLNR